jgi:hypothetical protein
MTTIASVLKRANKPQIEADLAIKPIPRVEGAGCTPGIWFLWPPFNSPMISLRHNVRCAGLYARRALVRASGR